MTETESRDVTPDSIHTVLVDDNEQWAEFIARDIEGEADDIEITVALSANEGMLQLQENDVDCIISDYQMPAVDGIQLLERVREDYPNLPFVLVTGNGSEDIAATAIENGVTDYIVKDPRTEQTVHFINKIRTAVKQYQLQRTLEESEKRYRTVTEQSRDAIGIIQDDCLRFCNRRMAELTGSDLDELRSTSVVEGYIHPDDRDRIRVAIDGWLVGSKERQFQECTIVRPDGTVRYCEITGQPITYTGDRGALVSIRDITRRKQRERELEWERSLNRNVQVALVESRSRADLERSIAEELHQRGYELVWITEQETETLSPRIIAGDRSYIDTLDLTIRDSESASEPSIWAARTGEAVFIQDFETLFPADWRDSALVHGYGGGAAIPLVYNDISYGLLVVYHDEPDRFDDTEQALLRDLADTVAFASHSLETRSSLASDHVVKATITVSDRSYYLSALTQDGAFKECESVTVQGTVPHTDDSIIQYVTIEGGSPETVRDKLRSHPVVRDVQPVWDEGSVRFQVTVAETVPEMELASAGVVVSSTEITSDGAVILVDMRGKKDVSAIVEPLEEQFGDISIQSITRETHEHDASVLESFGLTVKQATALEAAFHHGYFEQPRKSSATEIAESLDISHSTFLQHLRRAEQKVFTNYFI